MISAFGVDHGGVSKAFKALRPKLGVAYRADKNVKAHDTMDTKLRRHAIEQRLESGSLGAKAKEMVAMTGKRSSKNKVLTPVELSDARSRKVASQGMTAAISRNSRKKRTLP